MSTENERYLILKTFGYEPNPYISKDTLKHLLRTSSFKSKLKRDLDTYL